MAIPEAWRSRTLTVPNVITVVRLACIPWFLWLLLADDRPIAAGILLAVLGATDWVDGWIARHFDQGSELGKVLDPLADRILLLSAGIGLIIEGAVPLWVGLLVLLREALVSGATVWLAAAGARRIDVQWAGKAGTLAIMFAFPSFLFAEHTTGFLHGLFALSAWSFTIGGLMLGYYAAFRYIPLARDALREGRAARADDVQEELA